MADGRIKGLSLQAILKDLIEGQPKKAEKKDLKGFPKNSEQA